MPFHEPGADQPLLEAVNSGRLTVHADPGDVVGLADVVILSVGTPLAADLRADYGQLRAALATMAPHLRRGQLLILRSTVSPGTLVKVVGPYLRDAAPDVADGLLLATCPERIAEGKAMAELATLPEIVGGIDQASTEAAAESSKIRLQRMYRSQAAGFTATLPCGICLPELARRLRR